MMDLFSLEFWTGIGFIIDLILLGLLLLLSRRISRLERRSYQFSIPAGESSFEIHASGERDTEGARTTREIVDMLEPLVRDSKETAQSFEGQIREKKEIIKKLNDALDNRIININLLLSRAGALHEKIEARMESHRADYRSGQFKDRWQHPTDMSVGMSSSSDRPQVQTDLPQSHLNDQQGKILDMHNQGTDTQTIASTLNLPKGEVQLVIDLKTRLLAMERVR